MSLEFRLRTPQTKMKEEQNKEALITYPGGDDTRCSHQGWREPHHKVSANILLTSTHVTSRYRRRASSQVPSQSTRAIGKIWVEHEGHAIPVAYEAINVVKKEQTGIGYSHLLSRERRKRYVKDSREGQQILFGGVRE